MLQALADGAVRPHPTRTIPKKNGVGARLWALRDLASWSLEQACDATCGAVCVSTLSRAERNLAILRPDQVAVLEKVLREAIANRSVELATAMAGFSSAEPAST